jgi:cystathionine beta-lyase
MLCNPHNPTGRVFSNEELFDIANLCMEKNVIICSDEIHCDIVFAPNQHIPIASISEEISQSTITLISPSKTFNMAGLYASAVIITNPLIRERFINQARGVTGPVNLLGEVAMHAAYTHCDAWLEEFLLYLEQNRRYLIDFIETELPGVSMAAPEGTYLGWLDFSETNLDDPAKFLLDSARVALNPGDWFGSSYQNFARINFACQLKTLETALSRIKSALSST